MKKIIGLSFLSAFMIFMSCTNQPAEVKKEVIVTPPVIIKEKPAVVIKEEDDPSITLDKNGVKVKTKKVNVIVKH